MREISQQYRHSLTEFTCRYQSTYYLFMTDLNVGAFDRELKRGSAALATARSSDPGSARRFLVRATARPRLSRSRPT
jgi:hypothetical protein